MTKGRGGPRPKAYARRIEQQDWELIGPKRWVASAVDPVTYVRPTNHLVLHWQTEANQLKYSTVVCSITGWSAPEIIANYDDRGQCETEIQADKAGLKMERRRKKRLVAQEALILLTDLAHNLLAWSRRWMFPPSSPLAHFGSTRLIEDVLCMPGHLHFQDDELVEVHLNKQHPHAQAAADSLQRLLAHFEHKLT